MELIEDYLKAVPSLTVLEMVSPVISGEVAELQASVFALSIHVKDAESKLNSIMATYEGLKNVSGLYVGAWGKVREIIGNERADKLLSAAVEEQEKRENRKVRPKMTPG